MYFLYDIGTEAPKEIWDNFLFYKKKSSVFCRNIQLLPNALPPEVLEILIQAGCVLYLGGLRKLKKYDFISRQDVVQKNSFDCGWGGASYTNEIRKFSEFPSNEFS